MNYLICLIVTIMVDGIENMFDSNYHGDGIENMFIKIVGHQSYRGNLIFMFTSALFNPNFLCSIYRVQGSRILRDVLSALHEENFFSAISEQYRSHISGLRQKLIDLDLV